VAISGLHPQALAAAENRRYGFLQQVACLYHPGFSIWLWRCCEAAILNGFVKGN
jgi:hypothetical protein